MDEDLGTLSFKFRALKDQFRQDLLEMDRMVADSRQRWESGSRIGAPVMSGGGGGPSVRGGPNIGGTSNGDVSWNLASAVRDTQARTESSSGYRGGGGRGAFYSNDTDRMAATAMPWGMSSRLNPYTGERLGVTEVPVKPESEGGGGSKTPWYRSRLMLRGIVAVQVVDAIASELNNEENYKKAARLAGNDPGAQSAASLARTRGAYESIPLIGGMLYNGFNGARGLLGMDTEQSIETQNALTQQQLRYQDTASGLRLGATSMRLGAQALVAGNSSYGSSLRNQQSKIGRDAAYRASTAKLYADAGFEDESGPGPQFSMRQKLLSNLVVPGAGLWMAAYDWKNTPDYDQNARNNAEKRRNINAQLSPVLAANRAMDAAEEQDRKFTNLNTIDLQNSQLIQGSYNLRFMPTRGGAAREVMDYRAKVDDAQRRGMDESDRTILTNSGQLSIQNLQQQQMDVMDNYRWGGAKQFDPFVQSTSANMDRDGESISDKIEALNDGIRELTTTIKTLNNGGSGGGAPH